MSDPGAVGSTSTRNNLATAPRIFADAFELLAVPPKITVAEYATRHRFLANTGGGYVGQWDHRIAPYLAGPMEALTRTGTLTVALVGPGQCGKTECANNWILYSVANDPANILFFMQTSLSLQAYVKTRIEPLIDSHALLSGRLGRRSIDNSLHFKRFRGSHIEFLSATKSNLINKSAPRIIADEVDAYPEALGDIKTLIDVRRQTYGGMSRVLAISHPDRANGVNPQRDWRAGIMRIYADSTRRVWYWPCPQCGAWSSPVPTAKRVMTLEWPVDGTFDEIEAQAHLKCPVNGCVIEDNQRRAMNIAAYNSAFGGWVGEGQQISEDGVVTGDLLRRDTDGYWIVGVMSPFLLKGIGGLARELAKAEREFEISGDEKDLKEVWTKQLGIPFTSRGPIGSIDAETLAERAIGEEQPLEIIPEGVRFLTAWVDIQPAYFEALVRGWGVDAESWVIAKYRIAADTTTDRDAWDKLLIGLLEKRYPLATDEKRGMAIRALGFDSAGAPGTSDQAYAAWRRLKGKKKFIRDHGILDGRAVWNVILTKGSGNPSAPRLSVVYPDTQRKDRKIVHTGTVPLLLFNANSFKDDLGGQLRHALPGPGYVHIPRVLRSKEPPHVNFEQLVSEKRDANGRWGKVHHGARNEMLDLMVGCHILAHLHGLVRIKWATPPSWAAEWNANSMIAPIEAGAAAAVAATKKTKSITDFLGPR